MTVSLRAIKIALATTIAILIAQAFQLEYSVSAGVVAILSVLDTKKSSVIIALQRVGSTILALGVATILFQLVGFNTIVFGIYLLIYIPLAYKLNLEVGIAPCSVLVSHLLLEQSTSITWLANEMSLMVIGVGMAILFNLYMPSKENQLMQLRDEIEEKMKHVLMNFAVVLETGYPNDQVEIFIKELSVNLKTAEKMAYLEFNNQLLSQNDDYMIQYIDMRQQQAKILAEMSIDISVCSLPTKQNDTLARLFQQTANQLHESNPAVDLMKDLESMLTDFRNSDLPKTRSEFENRAALFVLLNDFSRFIQIKKDFYEQQEMGETTI
ncbi:aromatic acid exporter family protein [Carnobacterium sp. ISL-102]|uniref:aromatic acid exporter family protein n=1 Tax=Carnobacterium sp. ISL-102 TaxID=2819142 RepID=UPI001BE56C02|nr:aromatic acid exporter family protein [Carnobacterium sp. ISL-102]MBT2732935.1 aromatic acid exporter family protein [Carnobacterium sp. ISL-102]